MPDGGQYPLEGAPFTYNINATDYLNGMKNKSVAIGAGTTIFYGFTSIVDIIRRTLFTAADYPSVCVNWLLQLQPNATAAYSGTRLSNLYMHTDIFYDYDDGPDSVYDALTKILLSFRARLLFSAGEYWIQRCADAYAGAASVEYILNESQGVDTTKTLFYTLPSQPTDAARYVEGSGLVRITPAIYQQKANYKLKAINRLTNFLWADLNNDISSINYGRPLNWILSTATAIGTVTRGGSGTQVDPWFIRVSGELSGSDEATGYLGQTLNGVKSAQYIQVDLKGNAWYSTGLRVRIIAMSTDGTETHYIDSSGNFTDQETDILVSGDKKTRAASLSFTSKRFPGVGLTYNIFFTLREVLPANDPEDPVPSGQVPHNDFYPIFIRFFSNLAASIETTTTNSKTYSNIPSAEEPTFLDMADPALSNCIFYTTDSGVTYKALPFNNWKDLDLNQSKSLDEWSGRTTLDQFNVPSNIVEAEIYSNMLEFHHTLVIPDVDSGIKAVQLSDTYEVREGRHQLVCEQVYAKGSGAGSYTLKSINK